jgi:hypothetical protein
MKIIYNNKKKCINSDKRILWNHLSQSALIKWIKNEDKWLFFDKQIINFIK